MSSGDEPSSSAAPREGGAGKDADGAAVATFRNASASGEIPSFNGDLKAKATDFANYFCRCVTDCQRLRLRLRFDIEMGAGLQAH